jgi:hypothetical protein
MGQLVRLVASVVPMMAVLWYVPFPNDWFGLIGAIASGCVVFGVASFALDTGGIRSMVMTRALRKPALVS